MIKAGFVLLLILVLFVSACSSSKPKIEDNIQTFDDLKKAKEAGQPISELDKCITEARLAQEKYDDFSIDCINKKLLVAGYSDGIDCIQDYDTRECQEIKRYNAQVDAYNQCMDEIPADLKNRITPLDCTALVK